MAEEITEETTEREEVEDTSKSGVSLNPEFDDADIDGAEELQNRGSEVPAKAKKKGSKTKEEPGEPTIGMLNRTPGADCPLCPIWGIPWDENDPDTWGKQHIYAERLWNEWNPQDKSNRWVGNVIEIMKELEPGVDVTEAQVKKHFGKDHRIEQPMLSSKIDYENRLFEVQQLPDVKKKIISGLFRQKVLMTHQIMEVYYHPFAKTKKTASNNALTAMNALASNWYVYRYLPSEEDGNRRGAPKHLNRASVWFLGKASIPYIQDTYEIDQKFYPHFLNRATDIDANNMAHDIKSNEIFVSMMKKLNELDLGDNWKPEQEGSGRKGIKTSLAGDVEIGLLSENWYGPGMTLLPMGFVNPMNGEERRLFPDGFASLSIGHSSKGMPSAQLPFFIEYDHSSKSISEVSDQLLSYHLLGLSGSAKKRFPQLDIDNYITPVLMVFSNKTRSMNVSKAFQEKAAELGIEAKAPIWITDEETWEKNPFDKEVVFSAWDEDFERKGFIDSLILSSEQLIKSKSIDADTVLELDTRASTARSDFTRGKKKKEYAPEPLPEKDSEEISWGDSSPEAVEEPEAPEDAISWGETDDTVNTLPEETKEETEVGLDWGAESEDLPESSEALETTEIEPISWGEETDELLEAEEETPDWGESTDDTPPIATDWGEETDSGNELISDGAEISLETPESSKEEWLPESEENGEEPESLETILDRAVSDTIFGQDQDSALALTETLMDKVETLRDHFDLNNPEDPEIPEPEEVSDFPPPLPVEEAAPPPITPEPEPEPEPIPELEPEPEIQMPLQPANQALPPVSPDEPSYEKNVFFEDEGDKDAFQNFDSHQALPPVESVPFEPVQPEPEPVAQIPAAPEPDSPELAPFDPVNPLAPNNLTGMPGAPVYTPADPETNGESEAPDLSSLPPDSPIRRQYENKVIEKDPIVAPGVPEAPIPPVQEAPPVAPEVSPEQAYPPAPVESIPEQAYPPAPAPAPAPAPPVEPPAAAPIVDPVEQFQPASPPPVEKPPVYSPPQQDLVMPNSPAPEDNSVVAETNTNPDQEESLGGVNKDIEAKMNTAAAARRARRRKNKK